MLSYLWMKLKILMKKSIVFVFAVVVLSSFVFGLKLIKIKAGRVSMSVPDAFELLDAQTVAGEYSGKHAPIAVYRSPRDKSALIIYEIADSVKAKTIDFQRQRKMEYKDFERDLQLEYAFKKSSFSGKFREVNYLNDGIVDVNGKQMIKFELEGTVDALSRSGNPIETKVYNYMLYAFDKEMVYSINFICDQTVQQEYMETVHKMMKTVKIK